jgi:hypothetical protein
MITNHRNSNNGSSQAQRLAQVESDIECLAQKATEVIHKAEALERFFAKLAMEALGDTPETYRLVEDMKASSGEALLDVTNPLRFIRR